MKAQRHISLLWKMLLWLLLHLFLLAMLLFSLVFWQFRNGLDSMLRGPAGDRLRASGERMAAEMRELPPYRWSEVLDRFTQENHATCDVWQPHGDWTSHTWNDAPRELMDRLKGKRPPVDARRNPPGEPNAVWRPLPEDQGPRGARPFDPFAPPTGPEGVRGGGRPPQNPRPLSELAFQPVTPLFLFREKGGTHYWAAVQLPLPGVAPDHVTWVIRADDISGDGLFFDVRPFVLIVIGIFAFSILFWLPFVLGITRYIKKLKTATDRIAEGHFDTEINSHRADELGSLGSAISSMSKRIDHLLKGQKRFLGDVAHELCSPLARMRTALGILESRLPETEWNRLRDIEAEAAELAHLIDEILTFSRSATGMPHAKLVPIALRTTLEEVARRETPQLQSVIDVDPQWNVIAEPKLLQRAVANVFRNASRHAGESAQMSVKAELHDDKIHVLMIDNGPGVPDADIIHLFEPFYRPDLARTRDSGGTGLGLTIVKSCIEACGGSVSVSNALPRGFCVTLVLPLG